MRSAHQAFHTWGMGGQIGQEQRGEVAPQAGGGAEGGMTLRGGEQDCRTSRLSPQGTQRDHGLLPSLSQCP